MEKGTPTQVFFCEFCKKTIVSRFFPEHLRKTAFWDTMFDSNGPQLSTHNYYHMSKFEI